METLFLGHEVDLNIPPMPFNEAVFYEATKKKGMRIGYFDDMPLFRTTPSVKRAVDMVRKKLEALGHTLVPFNISEKENFTARKLFYSCIYAAHFNQFLKSINERFDKPIDLYAPHFMIRSWPNWLQKTVNFIVRKLVSVRVAHVMTNLYHTSYDDIDELYRERIKFEDDIHERWRTEKLDALICPAYYHSAYLNST